LAGAAGRCAARSLPGPSPSTGGEQFDTAHVETRELVRELGLALDNLLRGETNGT
jgi:hypothetical protein